MARKGGRNQKERGRAKPAEGSVNSPRMGGRGNSRQSLKTRILSNTEGGKPRVWSNLRFRS